MKENGYGFAEYEWDKPASNNIIKKIVFVEKIKEWDWIVGSGVYVDELDKLINENKIQLKSDIIKSIKYLQNMFCLIVGLHFQV